MARMPLPSPFLASWQLRVLLLLSLQLLLRVRLLSVSRSLVHRRLVELMAVREKEKDIWVWETEVSCISR